MAVTNPQTVAPPPKGRLLFGGAVFVLGLLCPLLVLGGDFWDKLRALFVRDAKAQFPDREPVAGLGG